MKSDTVIRLWCATLLMLVAAGCGEKLGGGSRTVMTGTTAKQSVFGIRAGKKLGFVIFTDLPSSTASAGSSWSGRIEPEQGPLVEYQGDTTGLIINGTRYEFAGGRVFLVSTADDKVSAKQVDLPVGYGHFEVEFEAITKRKEVQDFLGQ